eukprot:1146684-Pelagomonas_calceolata.AAC.6
MTKLEPAQISQQFLTINRTYDAQKLTMLLFQASAAYAEPHRPPQGSKQFFVGNLELNVRSQSSMRLDIKDPQSLRDQALSFTCPGSLARQCLKPGRCDLLLNIQQVHD